MMKLKSLQSIFVLLLLVLCNSVHAVGTPAGTPITNNVTVNFNVGGVPGVGFGSTVFQVQEVINVNLVWQDVANVIVAPGATAQILTFLLTNTGNGNEDFSLVLNNSPIVVDDFDPFSGNIYLDGNGNGTFDGLPVDPLYVPGTNDPSLDANGVDNQIIFLLSDIPGTATTGQTGVSELTSNALTAGAAGAPAGTNLNGLGDGGIDAVVGTTQATAVASGTYEVNSTPVDVSIIKSAQVINDGNGCSVAPCDPIPGATIRYSLQVTIFGAGTVDNLVITDPIPVDTAYTSETITLDGVALTDSGVDADAGNFSANIVTVNLGTISSPVTYLITFDVTIN